MREPSLLGHQHAISVHLLLGQLEAVGHHRGQRAGRITLLGGDRDEAGPEVLDRLVHDLVEAVLLRLEVVVERRGSDADVVRDVGPLRVLVPVPAEALRGRGEDLLPLAPSAVAAPISSFLT